jgi:hypothetical protein
MEELATPLAALAAAVEASAEAAAEAHPQLLVLPAVAEAMPVELLEPLRETMRGLITRSKTTAALAAEAQGSAPLLLSQQE